MLNTIFFFYRQDIGAAGAPAAGGGGQSRLQLGMFTIFPAFGIVLPNGHATITVDCAPENTGKCEEVRLHVFRDRLSIVNCHKNKSLLSLLFTDIKRITPKHSLLFYVNTHLIIFNV